MAASRIIVLVERSPVEPFERPRIGCEVRGNPVEDHADPVRVQMVDEEPEVVGRAHRRDGRVEVRHLVAPRAGVRVMHHRQQLDVREPDVLHVRGQLDRELAPAEALPPRRRMHLVDRHRPLERLLRTSRVEPVGVEPLVLGAGTPRTPSSAAAPARRRAGSAFSPSVEMELVALPRRRRLDDAVPDARRVDGRQRIGSRVPVVEVADHAHVPRVRRPHRETDARLDRMCAELRPQLFVPARPRQPDVELTERGSQTGTSSSSMRASPTTGMRTQSGRLLSS